jgi:hypothetical protein
VWQFKFVCCPQVPEISSVAHQLSSFGDGLLLCWFLCLTPFLWDKVGDLSASPLLSACSDGLLIGFQFCSVVWFWMLLTCSWDELCGPATCPISGIGLSLPAVGPSAFPAFIYSSLCLHGDQLLASPPSPVRFQQLCPFCSVLVFSSLFIV